MAKAKIYERCRICNLPLKTERSKKRGYGLKCAKKFKRGFGGVQIEQFEDASRLSKKLHTERQDDVIK